MPKPSHSRPAHHGFTLIELMITIAIVAVLTSIAIPAYTDYVRRGKIINATQRLSDARVRMEQFFLDNRAYPAACPAFVTAAATNDAFDFTCGANSATTYTIVATGRNTQGMSGFQYTINERNQRTSQGPSGWTASNNCWIVRKDGTC